MPTSTQNNPRGIQTFLPKAAKKVSTYDNAQLQLNLHTFWMNLEYRGMKSFSGSLWNRLMGNWSVLEYKEERHLTKVMALLGA